jgi:uncharacterized protein YndB with AHSA1/START domain
MSEYGTLIEPTTLRFSRRLPGSAERVWPFLVDSEKRGRWFAAGPWDLRPGGDLKLSFRHNDLSPDDTPTPERFKEMENGFESGGKVLEVHAPYRVVFAWGKPPEEDIVTFELHPVGDDQVDFVITHERLRSVTECRNVATGWHAHVAILEDVLAGRTPRPFWPFLEEVTRAYEERISEAAPNA